MALEVPLNPTHSKGLPTTETPQATLHRCLVCAEPWVRVPWAPCHPREVQPERPNFFPCIGLAALPRRLGSDPGARSPRLPEPPSLGGSFTEAPVAEGTQLLCTPC